ncbi:facilitated trehalose transporter Tret1-2 homolog [Battus philenor]|uniref:facilitated trehalose transporter Tret1-2 homolog n=1 Tax=Battus philenor TaxID=42288 RepID=UPI0035CEA580
MVICCYNFTSFFWPESPQWLASKGRFDECKTAFRWLNGIDEDSETELKNLIDNQSKYLSTIVLKFAPKVFKAFGLHGTFLLYGIVTTLCTLVLYWYLPETKDKTLQEIEEHFKKETRESTESKEENKTLVAH